MARKTLKCTRCSRSFSMPAHLARHMNTIHGAKGKSAGGRKKKGGRRGRGRPAAGGGTFVMGDAVANGAARLLSEMESYQTTLLSQRHSIDAEIDAIARAMQELGSTPGPRVARGPAKRGRPPGSGGRKGSLKDYIVRVLSQQSKPLGPRDIGDRVIKAGYKTKSHDITKAVSNTLPQLSGVKKVGFGLYQMS